MLLVLWFFAFLVVWAFYGRLVFFLSSGFLFIRSSGFDLPDQLRFKCLKYQNVDEIGFFLVLGAWDTDFSIPITQKRCLDFYEIDPTGHTYKDYLFMGLKRKK